MRDFGPLCHIAHNRPTFPVSRDWEYYEAVNRKFARCGAGGNSRRRGSRWWWFQDYHFALLPRLIKQARPDARVAIFWHIPWPNPEAFGICPWQRELLDGLLGADLVGFHIQTHCTKLFLIRGPCARVAIEARQERVHPQRHSDQGPAVPLHQRGEDSDPSHGSNR
jgi:trehalose-6-phosphate synthase